MSSSVDRELVAGQLRDAVREAVKEVFYFYYGEEPTEIPAATSSDSTEEESDEIESEQDEMACTLSLFGDFSWNYLFIVPGSTAAALARSFVGSRDETANRHVETLMTTLAVESATGAVQRMRNKGVRFFPSIPVLCQGKSISVFSPSSVQRFKYPFRTKHGPFQIRMIVPPAGGSDLQDSPTNVMTDNPTVT